MLLLLCPTSLSTSRLCSQSENLPDVAWPGTDSKKQKQPRRPRERGEAKAGAGAGRGRQGGREGEASQQARERTKNF